MIFNVKRTLVLEWVIMNLISISSVLEHFSASCWVMKGRRRLGSFFWCPLSNWVNIYSEGTFLKSQQFMESAFWKWLRTKWALNRQCLTFSFGQNRKVNIAGEEKSRCQALKERWNFRHFFKAKFSIRYV